MEKRSSNRKWVEQVDRLTYDAIPKSKNIKLADKALNDALKLQKAEIKKMVGKYGSKKLKNVNVPHGRSTIEEILNFAASDIYYQEFHKRE